MEEKNEQGPSEIVTAKEPPVPTLQELQNYILFLKSRIEKFDEGQTRLEARVFILEGKEWMREEREKERGRE